jgi:hypothetical protein
VQDEIGSRRAAVERRRFASMFASRAAIPDSPAA